MLTATPRARIPINPCDLTPTTEPVDSMQHRVTCEVVMTSAMCAWGETAEVTISGLSRFTTCTHLSQRSRPPSSNW